MLPDLKWTQDPSTLIPIDQGILDHFARIQPGVPHSGHEFRVDAPCSEVDPTRGLATSEYSFLVPGLLYTLIQLDQSIMNMYASSVRNRFRVKTHLVQDGILRPVGVERPAPNPWFATIQGVELPHAQRFRDYVASYGFKRDGIVYECHWHHMNILDPFWSGEPRVVPIWFLGVKNMATGRNIVPVLYPEPRKEIVVTVRQELL